MKNYFKSSLLESIHIKEKLIENQLSECLRATELFIKALKEDNKILICGNGGSAADAQHIATELIVRLSSAFERSPIPAIALTTNTSILTAISNDYGFDYIFSRQISALGKAGDILLAISTSGNSTNIIEAINTAKDKNMSIIGLSGQSGGKMKSLCDSIICVPSDNPNRIQEVHITIAHIWCALIEQNLYHKENKII